MNQNPESEVAHFAVKEASVLGEKQQEGIYKPSTVTILRIYIDTQLRRAFGAKLIANVTTPEAADWFHSYSKKSPGGANQALGFLKTTSVSLGTRACCPAKRQTFAPQSARITAPRVAVSYQATNLNASAKCFHRPRNAATRLPTLCA